jgi:ABC-type nitrate/sulfonate/bicarbonate transport system substrate-binding protein
MFTRFLIPIVLFGALSASCSTTTNAIPTKPLRVGTVPYAAWAALDVGIAKGFYKEFGVDLQTVSYEGEDDKLISDTIDGTGNIDIGMYLVGTFQGPAQAGKKVKWLGTTDRSFGADQLIGRDPLEVDAIKNKTKKVALYSDNAATRFFVERYLQDTTKHPSFSLSLKDADVIGLAPDLIRDQFKDGALALTMNYEPFTVEQRAAGGKLIADSRTYPGVLPNGVAMNEDKYAAIDKNTLVGFWKGWLKSLIWIFGKDNTSGVPDPAHRAELFQIMREKTVASKNKDKPGTFTPSTASDQELEGYLANAPALLFKDFDRINAGTETDIKILEYNTKGVQTVRSHITEMSQFVVEQYPGSKPIELQRFYDGKEVETAIKAFK